MTDFAATMRALAQARIRRYERASKRHHDEIRREGLRTTLSVSGTSYPQPTSWSFRKDFNPFIVRARSDVYAHGIRQSLKTKKYAVGDPYVFEVQKTNGGSRKITSFGIPDEALSRRTYRSLMSKNMGALSGRSYGYRSDINVFDAIAYVSREWQESPRLYVAEFDLKDYFGSVGHNYLFHQMEKLRLRITPRERLIIESFLQKSVSSHDEGFPQGTSISLFLSSVALSPLDRALERLDVGFARFSDDILLWGVDYGAVRAGVDMLFEWSSDSGVSINRSKSRGLQILSPVGGVGRSEIRDVDSVEFLSHRLSLRSVGIARGPQHRIRSRISDLIYANLLRHPSAGSQDMSRLAGGVDRDYVTLVSQLRRLLYGGLSERQVKRFSRSGYIPQIHLTGFVARHPLVTEEAEWRALDSWVRQQVWLALRSRATLLRRAGFSGSCTPWDGPMHAFDRKRPRSRRTLAVLNLELPSTRRMGQVVRRATQLHGTRVTERPRGIY